MSVGDPEGLRSKNEQLEKLNLQLLIENKSLRDDLKGIMEAATELDSVYRKVVERTRVFVREGGKGSLDRVVNWMRNEARQDRSQLLLVGKFIAAVDQGEFDVTERFPLDRAVAHVDTGLGDGFCPDCAAAGFFKKGVPIYKDTGHCFMCGSDKAVPREKGVKDG